MTNCGYFFSLPFRQEILIATRIKGRRVIRVFITQYLGHVLTTPSLLLIATWTYPPPTFWRKYEKDDSTAASEWKDYQNPTLCRWMTECDVIPWGDPLLFGADIFTCRGKTNIYRRLNFFGSLALRSYDDQRALIRALIYRPLKGSTWIQIEKILFNL